MAAISTAARQMFPDAPEPFIDLSTGINPHPYPLPDASARNFRAAARSRRASGGSPRWRRNAMARRRRITSCPRRARKSCCRRSRRWCRPGAPRSFAPTYAEHARAASLAGHDVTEVAERRSSCEAPISPSSSTRTIPTAALFREPRCWASRRSCGRAAGFSSSMNPSPTSRLTAQASPAKSSAETSWCCDRSENSSGLPVCGSALRWPRQALQTNSIDRSALGLLPVRLSWSGGAHWRTKPGGDGRLLLSQRPPNGSTSSSPGQVLKTSAAHRFTGSLDPPARMDYSITSGARAFWSGALRRIRPGCDGDILTVRQIGSD